MVKEFKSENHASSMLKFLYNEIVSVKFMNYSLTQKKNLIENLDNFINQESGFSETNLIYEDNYDNVMLNDVYVGDLSEYSSGFELLSKYFFQKRLQYQKNCINDMNIGSYEKHEFSLLCNCYNIMPVSNKRMYFSYNEDRKKFLYNYNVLDAGIYACGEMAAVYSLIDYDSLFKSYNSFEIIKFLISMSKSVSLNKKRVSKLNKIVKTKEFDKFERLIKELKYQEKREYNFLNKLKKDIESSNEGKLSNLLTVTCFDSRVWDKLDLFEKLVIIEKFNEFCSKAMDVSLKELNHKKNNIISMEENTVDIGEVPFGNVKDIFNSIIYTYVYSAYINSVSNINDLSKRNKIYEEIERCNKYIKENDFEKIKNSFVIKDISSLAVGFQKKIYDKVKNDDDLKKYTIDFYGDKESFVYDLYRDLNKKKR